MKTINTEVLIIGSGFGAAAPALRLSKAGFEVLMIEKGKSINPEKDFKQTSDPKYYMQYYRGMSNDFLGMTYIEALGGASGFYEMVSLRAPSKVFNQTDNNGKKLWPDNLSRLTFNPYYSLAENMLKVSQMQKHEIPKTGVAFSKLMKNLQYSCDRSRYAVSGCLGSGFCYSGCIFKAKQSLLLNYLPQAQEAGMKILTETEAVSVSVAKDNFKNLTSGNTINRIPFRYIVSCRDTKTGEEFEIQSKILILGGGTIGTAKLLLKSKENLPLLSSQIGKNIAINGSVKSVGLLPDNFIEGDMLTGRSHPGMISYHFFDKLGITIAAAKLLPLQLITSAKFYTEDDSGNQVFWGESNVELMKKYKRKMIILYALGLTPPNTEIKQTGEDKFEIVLNSDENLKNYIKNTRDLLNSILTRNDCELLNVHLVNFEGKELNESHLDTSHMVGSCRMAENKDFGVVNSSGEVFEYPGLYISDGSAIPSSLAVNSSLTILANAERTAAGILNTYTKEKLT